ncbi:MAG TPA: SRPBCC family protein [Candidatus Limnocylindrales bacterium]|nr:SRPBCC family protein [Candidatus Limnocylindrales bacterium]
MIRFLLRATIVGAAVGWIADRWLASRGGGRGPEPIRSMVVIDVPIERVWRELADVEGQPRWMHDMKSVRVLTSGAIGVGTRAEADVRIFGMAVVDPIEITVFEPPTRFAIRHEGQFTGEGLIELEPGADRSTTIVRWDETLIPPYLPHLAAALLRPILERVFQLDLERLRELVEADPAGA